MNSKKASKKSPLKNKNILYYVIIAVSCFILYGQSIGNNFNIDDDYVYENHQLVEKGINGIPEIFTSRYNTRDEQYFGYRPLTIAIYAVEYEIFGSNPHSAHFINILYYIGSCFLLFYLLQLIFKQKFPEKHIWISFIAVLLFLSHAIHTEVVLSIKNREEIVSLILGLASTIFALKFFDKKKAYQIILSVLLLSLAFLAKESAVVFIIIIPLTIVFFKTDIKVLSKFNVKNEYIPKLKDTTTILSLLLFVWIILFIVLSPILNIWGELKLNLHSFNAGINAFIAWGLFFANYTYILIRRKKTDSKVKISVRNIVFWSISIVLIILTEVGNSYLSGFLSMFLLIATLLPERQGQIFEVKWFDNISKKLIFPILGIVLIGGIILAVTYYVPKQALPETNAPVYKWQNPSFGENSSITDKAAVAIYSLGYYAKLSLIPYPLRFYYGYKMVPDVGISNPVVILSLLLHLFLLFLAIRGFNKRSLLSYGILFYLIAIFPFANTFFPLTGIIAERLLFVPTIGVSIVLTFLILKISKTDKIESLTKPLRNKTLILALVFILPNALMSFNRNPDWKDRKTLFTEDIKHLENSAKANTLYANLLIGEVYGGIKTNVPVNNYRSQIELATKHFLRAAEIDNTYSNPWHNLGYINMILYKNYILAEEQFTNSINVDSTVAASYLNRGIVNFYLKDYKQSLSDLEDYINKNKNIKDKEFDKAFVFSAKSHLALGDTMSATNYYILASENLKMENLSKPVLDDIKNHFMMVRRFDQAIKMSDLEISMNPNSDLPYVEKGNYYLLSGDTVNAVVNWEIAFEKFNGNFNIAMTLNQYFTSQGDLEKASYYYNTAIQYRQNQAGEY